MYIHNIFFFKCKKEDNESIKPLSWALTMLKRHTRQVATQCTTITAPEAQAQNRTGLSSPFNHLLGTNFPIPPSVPPDKAVGRAALQHSQQPLLLCCRRETLCFPPKILSK